MAARGAPGARGRGGAPRRARGQEEPTGPTVASLQEEVDNLKLQLEKEREERNYYQLERDKVTSFWEITKNELEEARAGLRNKDREVEELEENHQVQIKVYKQKVKHLLYEHQNKISELKKAAETKLTNQYKEHMAKVEQIEKTKRELKHQLKEQQYHNELHVKNMQQNHDKEITKLREDFDRRAQEMHAEYALKTKELRDSIDLKRKNELAELQKRKDQFIEDLMANHKKAFDDIKGYYFDITQNNMALIISLKDTVEDLKRTSAQDQKKMFEMRTALDAALKPLEEKRKEVEELQRQLEAFKKTKESLSRTAAQLRIAENEVKESQWEHEVLEQRFTQLEAERDELYDKFVGAIHTVQQKIGFKNLLLEKKLDAVNTELEKKDVQLNGVLAASNLEPAALAAITRKLEETTEAKNDTIRQLQFELARAVKAHNDTIRVYEAKLTEFGIPVDELGFRPMVTSIPGVETSMAPAGLVTG